MKITVEHVRDNSFVCVIHTAHEAYRVGPVGNTSECEYVKDEILASAQQSAEAAVERALDEEAEMLAEEREHPDFMSVGSPFWKG